MTRDLNLSGRRKSLLIEDQEWMHLFDQRANFKIKHFSAKLKKMVEERDNIEKQIDDLKRNKKKDMQMIIVMSQKANEEGDEAALQKMTEMQNAINHSNRQLEQLEGQQQNLLEKIEDTNRKLLEITVDFAYKEIKKMEEDLQKAQEEMDYLKNRLNDTINKKYSLEEDKSRMYKWVHSFLGSDETDKLDKDYLEEE